jgi:hypothetical protein
MWEHAYYLQVGLFIASSLLIRVLFAHFMIFSILMARLHTSRISGRSSTGRLLSSASRGTGRTLSRSSRLRCKDNMNDRMNYDKHGYMPLGGYLSRLSLLVLSLPLMHV